MSDSVWSQHHSAAAAAEHWDICFINADPARPEIEFLSDDPAPWTNDEEVLIHCAIQAVFGASELHATALRLEVSHDHHIAGLYAAERRALDNARPWILWAGGSCPFAPGTLVDVRHRDGRTHYAAPCGADLSAAEDWSHGDELGLANPGDIVAYRQTPIQSN